jgi:hypothetical protein
MKLSSLLREIIKENTKLAEVAAPSNVPSNIMYSLNDKKGMSGNYFYHIGTLLQALHRGSTILGIDDSVQKFYLHTVKFNSNVTIYPKVVNEDPEEGYDADFDIDDIGETEIVVYDNGVEGLDWPEPLPDGCKTANQDPNYSIYAHSKNFKVIKVEELTTGYNDETNQFSRALHTACKLEYTPDVDETKKATVKKESLWANINAKKKRGEKASHGNSKAFKAAKKAGDKLEKSKNETITTSDNITLLSVIDGKRNLDSDQLRSIFNDTVGTFYIYTNEEGEYEDTKRVTKKEALEYVEYYNSKLKGEKDKVERIGGPLGVLGIESELQFKVGELVADPTVFSTNEGDHKPMNPGILKDRLGKLSCSKVKTAKGKLKDKGTTYAKALQRYLNYHCQ